MKVKFGSIVVDGRGKIGGHVLAKNRSGNYMRTKVTPVNPQSSEQLSIRNRFTGLSQAWRGMSQAVRDAWNAAVANFSSTDQFGDIKLLSGFNLYQKLNNNLMQVGQAALELPPLLQSVQQLSISALVSTFADISITLSAAVDAKTAVKVYATPPQSPGKVFVKSEYRIIGILAPGSPAAVDILDLLNGRFSGYIPGTKIFIKIEAVNIETGQTGGVSMVSGVITEA